MLYILIRALQKWRRPLDQVQMQQRKGKPQSVRLVAAGYGEAHVKIKTQRLRILLVDVDAFCSPLQGLPQKGASGAFAPEGRVDKEGVVVPSFSDTDFTEYSLFSFNSGGILSFGSLSVYAFQPSASVSLPLTVKKYPAQSSTATVSAYRKGSETVHKS